MNRKIIITILIAFFLLIFCLLNYKKINIGNNKSRQIDIAENILDNIEKYNAEIEVEVNSNKNSFKYNLRQVEDEKYSLEEVTKGNNIEGLRIELSENTLKISNTKLNLEKIYENYNEVSNNSLFISTFIKDFKNLNNKSGIKETENEIIFEVEINDDKYIKSKELYINKETKKPTKMVIYNGYKKKTTSIIYNNIEIN